MRDSRTFPTKSEAVAWATKREAEILATGGRSGRWPSVTVAEVVERYMRDVTVRKKSRKAETLRLNAFLRDNAELCAKVFHQVGAADVAAWRDKRRNEVSDSTVVREAGTLRNLWAVATREWELAPEPSPWSRVKLPDESLARTRLPTWSEIKRLLRAFGYRPGQAPKTIQEQVGWCWLVCLHTALRASEARGLRVQDLDMASRVLRLEKHKTDAYEGVRHVPFTKPAARVLRVLVDAAKTARRDELFSVSPASLDALFRKNRDRLLISGMRFHDSRAAALTRLAGKHDALTLARISGHRDLRQLMDAYYRESPQSVAARI